MNGWIVNRLYDMVANDSEDHWKLRCTIFLRGSVSSYVDAFIHVVIQAFKHARGSLLDVL